MTSRYYVSPPLVAGEVFLDEGEARHCFSVMRARAGDEVELFDGEGRFGAATLTHCDRKRVSASVEVVHMKESSTAPLHLYVSLPKGDRQKWLVEKCVELGVATLTPMVTSRSVAQPTEKALERLRRAVIEACKQCNRNRLMEVKPPAEFATSLDAPAENCHRWIAHPYDATPLTMPDDQHPRCAMIGPEGGFSDEEMSQARASHWRTVQLGNNILRVETAALTLAALNLAQH